MKEYTEGGGVDEGFILSTGKKIPANCCMLSISKNVSGHFIFGEGYDDWKDATNCFTDEEKQEISVYFIKQWAEFGNLKIIATLDEIKYCLENLSCENPPDNGYSFKDLQKDNQGELDSVSHTGQWIYLLVQKLIAIFKE